MAAVDTTTLTSVINQCFANSMDLRFSAADRNSFLVEGKRLRGHLLNLLSAQFDAGTPGLEEANADLQQVNDDLSQSAASLANTAQTLNDIVSLVQNLDKLLGIASSFV
jgi:hypothetical protein